MRARSTTPTPRTLAIIAVPTVLAAIGWGVLRNTDPTFAKDVLPILQQSCQDCHRLQGRNLGGMVAPMPLTTYEEVQPWAAGIKLAVESGRMPPWHTSP